MCSDGARTAISRAVWIVPCSGNASFMRDSVFHASTFDCRQINLISLGEIVLAFLVTEFAVLQHVLGTTALTGGQWLLAVAPAVALFLLWETGKCIVRFRARHGQHVGEVARVTGPSASDALVG